MRSASAATSAASSKLRQGPERSEGRHEALARGRQPARPRGRLEGQTAPASALPPASLPQARCAGSLRGWPPLRHVASAPRAREWSSRTDRSLVASPWPRSGEARNSAPNRAARRPSGVATGPEPMSSGAEAATHHSDHARVSTMWTANSPLDSSARVIRFRAHGPSTAPAAQHSQWTPYIEYGDSFRIPHESWGVARGLLPFERACKMPACD